MSETPTQQSASPEQGPRPRRRVTRWVLLIFVPLLAAMVATAFYLRGGRYIDTDNAYVKADMLAVSPEVSGAITDVLVTENTPVTVGQVLFRLDPEPFRIAVSRAEARLAQVRTDLKVLKASYRAKQAEITMARTRLAFARREQQRQANLREKNFVSAARFDDARQTVELAEQQLLVAGEDLKRIAESLGGSVDTPIEQHPNYVAAVAELDRARLDLQRVVVRAPVAGIVAKTPIRGQYVAAGAPALALVGGRRFWVEANVTETDLTHVTEGQPAQVTVDTYPGVVWHGRVEGLSPATGAEFSMIPAQNATGNWVKISQRVPVRIRLDLEPGQPVLRSGLSATASIDTGRRRTLFGLAWYDAK